ncbi:MAG: helix-turn-helix domain-containing protein [Clostridiales bacterium]|nr:helix-turn-helix domain-containing protein [Clostridiales bacterium]
MENTNEKRGGYYAVIPANVRYDKTLSLGARILYGELTALSSAQGYCWAGNAYFAELYETSEATVWRWIKSLENRGYIRVDRTRRRDGTYAERKIYIADPSDNDQIAKMQSGENTTENDHIAKMQSGENDADTHIAKMQNSPDCKNANGNNKNKQGLNNDKLVVGGNTARARANELAAQFDRAFNNAPGMALLPKRGYSDVRCALVRLAENGKLDFAELTANDVQSFVCSLYSDKALRRRRHISDLYAYISKCVENTKRTVIEDEPREVPAVEYCPQLRTPNGQPIAVIVDGEVSKSEILDAARAADEWQALFDELEVEIHSLGFDVWIRPLAPLGYDNSGTLLLVTPSLGSRDEVNNRYLQRMTAIYKNTKRSKLCG